MYWKIPGFIPSVLNKFIWHGSRSNKTIYLTFDDGPAPDITEQVLNILEQYNARATFFCLGRNVDRHTELYKLILEKGHAVGNHTYSHLKGWKTPLKMYIHDINLAKQYIDSKLFRPPYGRIRKLQTQYLLRDYKIIMWDVLSHDYNRRFSPNKCLQKVIKNTKNGSIVVFHDSIKSSRNMLYTLPKFLKHFAEKGYKFEKITFDNI